MIGATTNTKLSPELNLIYAWQDQYIPIINQQLTQGLGYWIFSY